MREIKFRCWDGVRYIYFDNHQYDLVFNDISGWNVGPNIPNYKGEWTAGDSQPKTPDFKLEQFTGLKDKNGKEIYEGDIINCQVYQREEYDEYLSESPIKVVFENGCFYPFSYKFGWRSSVEDIEVIGNIHQNPDLL